ncbi:MAG: glycosyltransferase family 1 protein [Muribaculaceae bacterium]|nr:glycosyltransferase family 1 protein [Muribaculaceae bacterium]
MKILFAGDASNLHNTLAHQLRRMGHEAVVVSDGSRWMHTDCEIKLVRKSGTWGGIRYVTDLLRTLPRLRGYDVVQLSGAIFFPLRPEKLRYIFDYLRRHNGSVVYSALGTDVTYYDACHDGHTFRYSDYRLGDRPSPYVGSDEYHAQEQDNWRQPFMRRYHEYLLRHIDGATSALWEYDAAYRSIGFKPLAYTGIPIDTDALTFRPLEQEPDKVRFFIGMQNDRTVIKGTDRLLAALRRVHDRYPTVCDMDVVERLPYSEYTQRMRESHVILDQIYSYTPATNALIGMAQGLVAVSGAEPEYYDFIGEHDNHPIVNVNPLDEGDIDARLEYIITHKEQLPEWSRRSREFVVKHNAAPVVAQRYLDFLNALT